jgi:hypothetical protein
MKPLSAIDSSVLALIAENPSMSPEEFEEMVAKISPDAREIAKEITRLAKLDQPEPVMEQSEVTETARAILDWAKGNRDYLKKRIAASAD